MIDKQTDNNNIKKKYNPEDDLFWSWKVLAVVVVVLFFVLVCANIYTSFKQSEFQDEITIKLNRAEFVITRFYNEQEKANKENRGNSAFGQMQENFNTEAERIVISAADKIADGIRERVAPRTNTNASTNTTPRH